MLNSVLVFLAAATTVGQVAGTPTSYAHMREYGELLAGRWVGDITLIADWPGLSKKKGEKIVSYKTVKWILDNNALQQEECVGETMGRSLHYWDPGSKKIKVFGVNSVGGTGLTTVWLQDGKWVWEHEGLLPDGQKLVGTGTIEVKDGEKTVIYQGKARLDGKDLLPYRDVYTRVSKFAGN